MIGLLVLSFRLKQLSAVWRMELERVVKIQAHQLDHMPVVQRKSIEA